MQFDGDNLRNAFLNGPWVKAAISVPPGREPAAKNWLRVLEGSEHDGWDDFYIDKGAPEAPYGGMRVGEVLEARTILDELSERDGQTLLEICGRLTMRHGVTSSCQAISQHLAVLGQAGLAHSRRQGRYKLPAHRHETAALDRRAVAHRSKETNA